ncbi:MAG: cupin domain-containing protein [Pseudomonadota bacterium]|nr:cupin domain-containing protein [Pseudomonadota bacterium]
MTQTELLNFNQTGDKRLAVKKIEARANSIFVLDSLPEQINWVHILSGKCLFNNKVLSNEQICYIPEGLKVSFRATEDTSILLCTVNGYRRFEQEVADPGSSMRIVDWKNEPVLQSEYDDRKRIYIATRGLWGTNSVKGEIILYPKNTKAPAHHHEGAEHFQYILSGYGCAFVDGKEVMVETGDLVYNYENEIHWFDNKESDLFSFVEYFVPGKYKTVWAKKQKVCTWSPTGRNFDGGTPTRSIKGHRSDEKVDL